MDTIVASDLPYLLGFLPLVVLGFWFVAWLVDRGGWTGPQHPAVTLLLALYLMMRAVDYALQHRSIAALLIGSCALLAGIGSARKWIRLRARADVRD